MCEVTKSSHAVFYNCETSSKTAFWIHRMEIKAVQSNHCPGGTSSD